MQCSVVLRSVAMSAVIGTVLSGGFRHDGNRQCCVDNCTIFSCPRELRTHFASSIPIVRCTDSHRLLKSLLRYTASPAPIVRPLKRRSLSPEASPRHEVAQKNRRSHETERSPSIADQSSSRRLPRNESSNALQAPEARYSKATLGLSCLRLGRALSLPASVRGGPPSQPLYLVTDSQSPRILHSRPSQMRRKRTLADSLRQGARSLP